jgi:conjugative relaxase-like TrwC/TraI family protein
MTMGSLELVFSADKSVSVYAQGENRPAVVKAQRIAVNAAMQQIAKQVGVIRSRRGGLDRRDPADVTWVQWQHRFSRLGQPQIHTHVSLINVCRSRVDGKVGTLDTFLLHGFYPTVRETYHRALAAELGKLGLPVVFDAKVPAAVLTNVSYEEQRQASSRTVIAEKAAAEYVGAKLAVHFSALTPKQRSAWIGRAAWHTRPRTKRDPEVNQSRNEPSGAVRLRLDSRYNRGGGRYDDDAQRRGMRL